MNVNATKEVRRFARSIERLLFPAICLVCRNLLDTDSAIPVCDQCQGNLQSRSAVLCQRCGARFPELIGSDAPLKDCRFCRNIDLPVASAVCLGNYSGPLRQLVLRLKNRGQEPLAIQLGRWMGLEWNRLYSEFCPLPDVVTTVSVHWLRRIRRGYDVAELLGEGVCRTIRGNPLRIRVLKTIRPTKKQGTLSTLQRFENVKNCFAVRAASAIRGKNVLLVDDVMTSGATAIQATRALLKSGAAAVHLVFVARGVGGRS